MPQNQPLSNAQRQAAYRQRRKTLAAIGAAALEEGEGGPIPPAPLRHRLRTERTLAAEITRHRAEVRRLNKLAERRRGADRAALERKIHDAEAMIGAWLAVRARLLPPSQGDEGEPRAPSLA